MIILGPGASGKSTLAVQLGEITGLRVIELDKVFWGPNLVATPRDQWVKVQQMLVEPDAWILDGDLGPYDAVEVRLRGHARDPERRRRDLDRGSIAVRDAINAGVAACARQTSALSAQELRALRARARP